MDKNIITLKAVISTSLFLGGMVFTTPTLGAEIDDYSSLQQTSGKPAEEQNNIVYHLYLLIAMLIQKLHQ